MQNNRLQFQLFAPRTGMLAIVLFELLFLAGCGDQAQQKQRQQGSENAKPGSPSTEEKPGAPVKPGNGGKPGTTGTNTPVENNDACSGFSDKLSGPISAKGAAKVPILGSVNFTLDANAQFSFDANSSGANVALNAAIKSFSPAIARSLADNVINSYKDPLKLTTVPSNDLKNFHATTPGWQDLDCIVIPVKRISNSSYEYEFEPALPMLISPKASASDLTSKLGSGRTFPGIKSKLIRHFQPESVAKRTTYTGSASISGSGGTYRINYDFGTKAPNALATPVAGIEFGIKGGTGTYDSVSFSSFVADDSKIDLRLSK